MTTLCPFMKEVSAQKISVETELGTKTVNLNVSEKPTPLGTDNFSELDGFQPW